jgi:hypothetical protein
MILRRIFTLIPILMIVLAQAYGQQKIERTAPAKSMAEIDFSVNQEAYDKFSQYEQSSYVKNAIP